MSSDGFVIAMEARWEEASYDQPFRRTGSRAEWLIVSRWGAEAEYLTIAATGMEAAGEPAAPLGLLPEATYFGLLVSEQPGESLFLLARQLPPGLTVAGVFYPSDGFARLFQDNGLWRLQAAGRHAHLRGRLAEREVRCDVPHPPPGADDSRAWHIEAVRRPWVGECIGGAATGNGGEPPIRSRPPRPRGPKAAGLWMM